MGADIVGLVIGVFVAASMMGKETRDISPFRAILSNLKNRPKRPVVPKQIPVPEEKEEKVTGFIGFLISVYKGVISIIGGIIAWLIVFIILRMIALFIRWIFE